MRERKRKARKKKKEGIFTKLVATTSNQLQGLDKLSILSINKLIEHGVHFHFQYQSCIDSPHQVLMGLPKGAAQETL